MLWFTVPLAFLIDLVIGDPAFLPHPVRIMGEAIARFEKFLRSFTRSSSSERIAGCCLALLIPITAYIITLGLCLLADLTNHYIGILVSTWLISTTIAARGLVDAGRSVYRHLTRGEIDKARDEVGGIVGRDTDAMEEPEIVRATVETMAENIVDGVVAPIFFALIGGAPLALTYRAVNTLDSMVGYRNSRYLHFGWASARLDDIANYIPARITGLLIVLSAALLGYPPIRVLITMLRDSAKHPSPNSGIPESGVAGALGVQLGGTNYYEGIPSFRPLLGIPYQNLDAAIIRQTAKLIYSTGILAVLSGACIYKVIISKGW